MIDGLHLRNDKDAYELSKQGKSYTFNYQPSKIKWYEAAIGTYSQNWENCVFKMQFSDVNAIYSSKLGGRQIPEQVFKYKGSN